jgi:cAMP-dependent protein kinase regulator
MDIKLDELAIFRDLPHNLVTRILKYATTREFGPGEMVIREGEAGKEFFVLVEGTAEVLVAGGTPKRLSDPGTAFGEIALIERVKRTASVRAADKGE